MSVHHHDHGHDHHHEEHFTAGDMVRDIVIGMADGLTVPFALAAGISGAVDTTTLVVTAGLAEIAAGSIAMGLGGYLSGKGEVEHYANERKREEREVIELPDRERQEVRDVLHSWGLKPEEAEPIVKSLEQRPTDWVNFMMRFELGLEEPDPKRALSAALTIGLSYIVGGMIPLMPYILLDSNREALWYSVISTLLALFVFGFVKGRFTGIPPLRSALQTTLIGGLAAGTAYGVASLFS